MKSNKVVSGTSRLLINEPPLMVLPSLAKEIGLNEAIILQQLHYWLENPKVGVIRDGYKWIFNTYEEWRANFPFWSKATIQRAFAVLETKGLIISKQLDEKKRDMTKFYRLDYDKLNGDDTMHDSNLLSSNIAECDDVLTETTAETTTEKKPSEHKSMFGALTRICEVDPKLKAGQIAKTSQRLLKAGYHPSDVDNFILWWKQNDFRGLRGAPPTIAQVYDLILQSKNEGERSVEVR